MNNKGSDLKSRMFNSTLWLFGRKLIVSLIKIGSMAILARQLSPATFGLVALAQVLMQVVLLARDIGVGTYVIYDVAEGSEKRVNSAFWLNLVITVFQIVVLLLLSPFITKFFRQGELLSVLHLLGIIYFIQQFSNIPAALVQKRLDFQSLAVRDTALDFVSAVLSVAFALNGFGVWSLLLPQLVCEPIRVGSAFYLAKWKPSLGLGYKDWKIIGWYSWNVLLTNFLGLILNDGDTLIIGKVIGNESLGFYNNAWQLSNLIGKNITGVISPIIFPAFSALKSNITKLQSGYRKSIRYLSSVSFPLLIGMFILADELVLLVYGPKWEASILLLRILIIFTIVRSVTTTVGAVLNTVGRPDIGFRYNMIFVFFYIGAIILGSHWGIIGVAAGVMVSRTIGAFVIWRITSHLINLSFRKVIGEAIPFGIMSLAMGLFVCFIKLVVLHNLGIFARLSVSILIGGSLYLTMVFFFQHRFLVEILQLVNFPVLKKSLLKRT